MEITILAVSKRLNGVCIAGINKHNWIRPVKKEELMLEDIKINHGYIEALNAYEFHFSKRFPVQCQSENYLIDEHWEIIHKQALEDRMKFFNSICENSLVTQDKNISEVLKARNRSLILLGPVRLQSFHVEGSKAPEISFALNDIPVKGIRDNFLCTDLKFCAFAKSLLKQRNTDSINLNENELKALLGYYKLYVVIGLTKLYKGVNWPMVIGLHTIPEYRQIIDYNNL